MVLVVWGYPQRQHQLTTEWSFAFYTKACRLELMLVLGYLALVLHPVLNHMTYRQSCSGICAAMRSWYRIKGKIMA
jgi:hypothetical protein